MKIGKSSPALWIPYRNQSSVVELVGRGRLLFARAEIGVTQFKFRRKKLFWPELLEHFQITTVFRVSKR